MLTVTYSKSVNDCFVFGGKCGVYSEAALINLRNELCSQMPGQRLVLQIRYCGFL